MSNIPIQFPTEQERLRRLIDADRFLTFRERVQAIDGLLAAIETFQISNEARERVTRQQDAEEKRCLREFLQRQLAAQTNHR